jgi:ESS family glutamate:Na+ symporter
VNFSWTVFVDLGLISCALLLSTALRARVRFFQRYLVPNALTAGFMLLLFYNFLAPRLGLSSTGLSDLIYHLLSLSFIAMSLRTVPPRKAGRNILATGVVITASFTLQGILGLGLTWLLMVTLLPGLFPGFGLLIPLGFELGPGQAHAIGIGWEALGFQGAGSVALTFAAFGFLWACFGGVFLINLGVSRGWIDRRTRLALQNRTLRSGVHGPGEELPEGARLTTETEAIDSMSFNLAVVLAVYLLTFLLLKLVTLLLSGLGAEGRELAVNLWGISFIFAALLALAVKGIAASLRISHVLDNGSLSRIAGTAVDVLVAAAVGAISLVVVGRYWPAILCLGIPAGILTMAYILWISSRLFRDHQFQRAIMFYGASTGTLPTGLALLRVIDPEFETPVAVDYMYGSGIAFFLVIPYILALNFPAYGYIRGEPRFYWLFAGLVAAYLLILAALYRILAGRRAFTRPHQIWLPPHRR